MIHSVHVVMLQVLADSHLTRNSDLYIKMTMIHLKSYWLQYVKTIFGISK